MTEALVVAVGLLVVVTIKWRMTAIALREANDKLQNADGALASARTEIERLVAGLAGANDGLVLVDENGHIAAHNPAAWQLLSVSVGDHVGTRIEELLAWPRLHEALAAARRDGEADSFELETGDAVPRTLLVQVHSLSGLGAVISVEDQSRLKQLESLRRDFVANVSHELKTPLAAIKGFVETMQDDPEMPGDIRTRFLDRSRQQAERLATLVSDLLTLSRLDDDPGMQTADPCDFVAVLKDIVKDLLPIAEQREIALEADLPKDPQWVRGDRETLRQMAGNLVDNALKYTPEKGTVSVRMTLRGSFCRLEVADTGIGLSPGDQDRIFERFYRVDRARSRELGGTGLGLSIVKNTAISLGGDIGVTSELGVGSMFWIELPITN